MNHIVFQNLKSLLIGILTSSRKLRSLLIGILTSSRKLTSKALGPPPSSMNLVSLVFELNQSLHKLHYLVRVPSLSSRMFTSPHASTEYFPRDLSSSLKQPKVPQLIHCFVCLHACRCSSKRQNSDCCLIAGWGKNLARWSKQISV